MRKAAVLITLPLFIISILLHTSNQIYAFYPEKCGASRDQVLDTALGCIPTNPSQFLMAAVRILLGLGGGIAFLMMIIGAGFVLTSRGNPEAVNRGKEVFTGAIVGLLMMIFSTFLLELIGVDIFGLF